MDLKKIKIGLKDSLKTEEATKNALIMPFIMELGYNVFDPTEVIPEFVADIAKKNGEKVDYAIKINGKTSIIIEAKDVNENLENHSKQLSRYFVNTEAKIGILTNGLKYWFYTDLKKDNIMDNEPFFKFDLEKYTKEQEHQLLEFTKSKFDEHKLYGKAEKLMIRKKISTEIVTMFRDPSDEFVRAVINNMYDGVKTAGVITEYKKHIVKSYEAIMNAEMLKRMFPDNFVVMSDSIPKNKPDKIIETTELELSIFSYIKAMFIDNKSVDIQRIQWKDNSSYFNVLLDYKVTKWIVRVYDKRELKVGIFNKSKEEMHLLSSPEDIFELKDLILKAYEQRK